jgi:hypothetical protein
MELVVLHIPGLSARLLRDHVNAAPHLARVGGQGSAATLVNLDGASPRQQEAALITGLLPEYLGTLTGGIGEPRATPFWVSATQARELSARVQTALELPPPWRAADANPQFAWHTLRNIEQQGPTRAALHDADAIAAPLLANAQAAVVVSAWSFDTHGGGAPRSCHALERPVLLVRGIEQPKTCIGILEVAGLLQRALTGEVLRDEH